MAAITGYAEEPARLEPAAPAPPPRPRPSELSGHFIVCGAEESFCSFVDHLRKCGPADTPIVVLHPTRPDVVCEDGDRLVGGGVAGPGSRPTLQGPIYHVEGSASDAASLRQAGASTARALIYLARAGGAGWGAGCGVGVDVGACQSSRDAPRLGTAHTCTLSMLQPLDGCLHAACCVTGQPWLQRTRCQLACLLALQPGRCARPSPVAARWSRSAAPGRRCWRMRRPCWQCTVSALGPPVGRVAVPRVTPSGLPGEAPLCGFTARFPQWGMPRPGLPCPHENALSVSAALRVGRDVAAVRAGGGAAVLLSHLPLSACAPPVVFSRRGRGVGR